MSHFIICKIVVGLKNFLRSDNTYIRPVNLAPHILSNVVSSFSRLAGVKNRKTHVSKCCGAKINPVCRVPVLRGVFTPRSRIIRVNWEQSAKEIYKKFTQTKLHYTTTTTLPDIQQVQKVITLHFLVNITPRSCIVCLPSDDLRATAPARQ